MPTSLSACKKGKTKAEKAAKKVSWRIWLRLRAVYMAPPACNEPFSAMLTLCNTADACCVLLAQSPDPAGLAKIAEGVALQAEKKLDECLACYEEALAICKASTVAAAPKAPKVSKADSNEAKQAAVANEDEAAVDESASWLKPPSENKVAKACTYDIPEGRNYAINDDARLAENLAATAGRWRTRFPPEPNGYLHLGHAKAMNFVFGVASRAPTGGDCILRYDDTNPSAEKQEYIDSINANVTWLGHEPLKITYSSDVFDKLYDFLDHLFNFS